jgi:hypothetical protein
MNAIENAVIDLQEIAMRLEAYTEKLVRNVGDDEAETLIRDQQEASSNRSLQRQFDGFKRSAMGGFVSRFKAFDSANEWEEMVLNHEDLTSFLSSCGAPTAEVRYVASRSDALEAYSALRAGLEKQNGGV